MLTPAAVGGTPPHPGRVGRELQQSSGASCMAMSHLGYRFGCRRAHPCGNLLVWALGQRSEALQGPYFLPTGGG